MSDFVRFESENSYGLTTTHFVHYVIDTGRFHIEDGDGDMIITGAPFANQDGFKEMDTFKKAMRKYKLRSYYER